MNDEKKTKEQLIKELTELRRKTAELEKIKREHERVEDSNHIQDEMISNMAEGAALVSVEDATIVFTNARFEEMFGYDPGELLGMNVQILNASAPERSSLKTHKEIVTNLNKHGHWNGEVHNIKKDGTPFWSWANVSTFESRQYGRVWLGVHEDITERKRTEVALQESEEKYCMLIENMNDGLGVIDEKGMISFVNDRLCKMFGYSREEMIGSPVTCLLDEANQKIMKEQLAKRKRGGKQSYELEFTRKDGSKVVTITAPEPIVDINGHYMGSFAVMTDITERKQAEEKTNESAEKFRSIFESSNDAIMLLDKKGFFDCNESTLRIFGCSCRDEFLGKHPSEWSPTTQPDGSDSRESAEEKIATAFRKGRNFFEWMHWRANGKEFPAEVLLTPMQLEGIDVLQATVRDITKRKRAEEELKLKSQELEALTQDLRKMSTQLSKEDELTRRKFAGILHEQVGQNLSAIKIQCSEILKEYCSGKPKMKKTISYILSTLDDTVNSTRELTADLYPVILDRLGFIPAISWYSDLILKPKKLKLTLNIDESVESLSPDCKLSFFRIVQEAFHNIVKHAFATEVDIALKKVNRSIQLIIKDNGIGCDMKKIKKKKDKGIGLMLMKERALSLGGDFKIECVLEKGTRLLIEMPLKQ